LRLWSLGELESQEKELIQRFFDGIDKFTPTLVSWNGSGFDLPVLHYRALLHGVPAPRYWDTGDGDRDFRYNNYLNRFHNRHTDLMDVLSGYQPRAAVGLDEISVLLGFPGKMGQSGASVWNQFQAGAIEDIRNYCETDVVNTYLIYLRWELLRGNLDEQGWMRETKLLRESLAEIRKDHLDAFLKAWL
jgi:predicted PolB exonuclease-like 3'-5' exonuclease